MPGNGLVGFPADRIDGSLAGSADTVHAADLFRKDSPDTHTE